MGNACMPSSSPSKSGTCMCLMGHVATAAEEQQGSEVILKPPPELAELQAKVAENSSASFDLSARHEAYLLRKSARKERRSKRGMALESGDLDSTAFLSGVPEVEADISYRFVFFVVGGAAESVVEAACGSSAAQSLPGGEGLCSPSRATTPMTALAPGFKAHRCLCPVPRKPGSPPGGTSEQPAELAKLAFHPLGPGEEVPPCKTHLEALSTVLVFVLTLDIHSDIGSLEMQLWEASRVVERSRTQPASTRPLRAVLLCFEEGAGGGWADRRWASLLADFEQQHGRLWQFGPLDLADADALHGVFAEMACKRLASGGARSGAPRTGEGEQDEDADGEIPFSAAPSTTSRTGVFFEAESDDAG